MATLTFRCRDTRTGEDGRAPVDLRISHRGERRFISTDLRVDPAKWKDGSVTRSHPQDAQINNALRRIESAAQKALTSIQTSPQRVTAAKVKRAAKEELDPKPERQERIGFADFCEEKIQRMYDNLGTRRAHQSAVTKLRAFLRQTRGVDDVPLHPRYVTAAMLEEMQTWESEERGNKTNTIHKTMRTLRRMINVAIRDGLFPRDEYPFDSLTLRRERTEKTPLSAEQMRRLEGLLERVNAGTSRFDIGGVPAHSLRAFLFAAYMLGMRWSDVSSLEWSQLREGRIRYTMRKTGTSKDLKIVPPAEAILDWYRQRRAEQRFVFPFMERYGQEEDLSTEQGVGAAIRNAVRRVNQELKKIAGAAEVDVNLTTHIARHTSAQRMMEQGWSLQEIQAALGHASISTTEHYLRSVRDEELDDKHEELW